jgi:sugar lactone lactonase YvrE
MTPVTLSVLLVAFAPPPPKRTITAYAGTGEKGYAGDGGPAVKAKLDSPFDVAFDRNGNLYFSDTNNHCVRRVDTKTGVITTVAGCGRKGYSGDGGPATRAELNEPYGITFHSASNTLYIADRLNACVRVVSDPNRPGTIRTLAGTGKPGYSGDGGPAAAAQLREPNDVCNFGNDLLIADVRDNRIRVVDLATYRISTFAGTRERKTAGDGGPIDKATFAGPRALVSSADGHTLYVVEREGNCVRQYQRYRGTIVRFAGTGKKGYTGDGGKAVEAPFDGPKEIDIGPDGSVYVVDTENEAIRRIDAKTGIVTTVAGKGRTKTPGLGDSGPATEATLGRPHGVAIGQDGAVYIGDTLSHRIRVVR